MKDNNKIIEINFEDLDHLKLDFNKYVLTVISDEIKFEFLLNLRKNSDKIIVLDSSELGFKQNKKSQHSIINHLNKKGYSIIYFNDPTYYLGHSINEGWGIGTAENYYLDTIALILQKIFNMLNIQNRDILFYGNSSEGFTSLMLATLIRDTRAIVENPQIVLYNPKSYDIEIESALKIKKYGFNNISDSDFIDNYKYRLDVLEMIKREKYVPYTYLLIDWNLDSKLNTEYFLFLNKIAELTFENLSKIKLLTSLNHLNSTRFTEEDYNFICGFIDENYIKDKFGILKNIGSTFIMDKLKKYNTARIDIYSEEKCYINIISDNNNVLYISRPSWLNNNELSGLIINNCDNSIDFEIECEGDADSLIFKLRGIDIRNSRKPLPIYINFTKFVINNEVIHEGNRITWHNDPLYYKYKIKKGEKIKIHIEWIPL